MVLLGLTRPKTGGLIWVLEWGAYNAVPWFLEWSHMNGTQVRFNICGSVDP